MSARRPIDYAGTHPALAAGGPSPADLAYAAKVYRRTLGRLLPARADARVLEIGSGVGAFLKFLRDDGYKNVEGWEIDPGSAALARRLGIEVKEGDAFAALEKSPGAWDAVVALDVMEHREKNQLLSDCETVFAALKPGGVFLWRAPNGESPFFGRVFYADITHQVAFTRSSARQLMAMAGFKDVEVIAEEAPVTGARSLVRWLLWQPLSLLARLYLFAESYATNPILSANLVVRAKKPL